MLLEIVMNSEIFTFDLKINEIYYVETHSKDIVAYWVLVMITKLGGMKRFMEGDQIRFEDVADFLGLSEYSNDVETMEMLRATIPETSTHFGSDKLYRKTISASLEKLLHTLEYSSKHGSPILERNIEKLSNLIGLDQIDKDILRFVAYVKYYDILGEASSTLGEVTSEQLHMIFSVLLSHPREKIREAFSPKGRMTKTGIMNIDRNNNNAIRHKIDIGSYGFIEKMMTCDEDDIEAMIKDSVRRCEPNNLQLDDYGHLDEQLSIMLPYLRNAVEKGEHGVNILLYGRPGTGKTELVKTIAKELEIELFEVSYADDDDDPISGDYRLRAYRTAQTLLSKKKIFLMFDEIEDVMKNEDVNPFQKKKRQNNKGWFNRILETNPLPSIWITNDVKAIDEALIRRFDIVLEIPVPPKSKRRDIIITHSDDMLNHESIETIAKNENITPAIITRTAKVVKAIGNETLKSSKAFEMLVENTLKAQGYKGLDRFNSDSLPDSYDPIFVNTDHNLIALMDGIKYHQSARICLYGAPGTGKSAFGKWIARELDRPFILKKGSDLMSMWVGGTEKNIANAFNEAMEENAVLVFDEVDSFLQDRRTAKASWEVTQVNEMLVQMENYNGIFIATTNLMDGLDQASLRRFDLKLEFGYLKPMQALELFAIEAKMMGIEEISKRIEKEIQILGTLTPGDFAAVRRQGRFAPIRSAEELLERISDEVSIKNQEQVKTMGFLR